MDALLQRCCGLFGKVGLVALNPDAVNTGDAIDRKRIVRSGDACLVALIGNNGKSKSEIPGMIRKPDAELMVICPASDPHFDAAS